MSKPFKQTHKNIFEIMEEDGKYAMNVKVIPKDPGVASFTGIPVFNHYQVNQLYEFGLEIPDDIIHELLSLPHQTLAEDLVKIIYDTYYRYDELSDTIYNDKFSWLALHAFFLAREIKAGECLEPLLDFLSQDEEFLDFWLGDAIAEQIWSVIAACGDKQLERLNSFMKEPGRYTWSRAAVAEAVNQLALQGLIDRATAIGWLKDVLSYYSENGDIENLIDTDLNGCLVGVYLDLKADELSPLIENMFAKRLVPLIHCGDWSDVQHEMQTPLERTWGQRKIDTIYESYQIYRNALYYDEAEDSTMDEFDDYEFDNGEAFYDPPEPFVRTEPNIGRNDPCPCGSGKKYKKCHG